MVLNDLHLKEFDHTHLLDSFRESRSFAQKSIGNGSKIFSWTLHDQDNRLREFQSIDERSWERWLSWYKFHHFQWNQPNDPLIGEMKSKIITLGNKTWKNLFQKYQVNIFKFHDLYSLPDVYYLTRTLGRIPSSVIDIGAGWGRMGLAWSALDVKSIGITDSIEQPYFVQFQYLSAIPGIQLRESFLDPLLKEKESSSLLNSKGITHFPLWEIRNIEDRSIEVVSAAQVLREVSREFVLFLFEELRRILVPGGLFYVRDNDHEYRTSCMHNIKITETLEELGFSVVFQPSLRQGIDIHGIPRIFRWNGKCTARS